MGCMEWMQLQKKKQDQTNFFEIHLTLLHIFYVLFHSDTWMSLGGTRKIAYSNSSQGKYHQIKNADFMRHSTASISSNVTLFISFLKTLVAN